MSSLTLRDILIKSSDYLKNKGISKYRLDAELIISHILNIPRMNIYLEFEKELNTTFEDKIRQAVVERGKHMPLQYIIGNVCFMDCIIDVNANVLIPRPETEYLVESQNFTSTSNNSLLDLCTGSGAIAIGLKKKYPELTVYASDICPKALDVAKINATKNKVEVNFILSDMFTNIDNKFDVIISNPPYVSENEYNNLDKEISFEPKLALVADNDGLQFYEIILSEAANYLNHGGYLILEIGETLTDSVLSIAERHKYNNLEIINDLNGRNRGLKWTCFE